MNNLSITKNDPLAIKVIWTVAAVLFAAIFGLSRVELKMDLGFDPHIFALINACINGTVSVLLVGAIAAVKTKNIVLHKKMMLSAIVLSVLFLISYVLHHLFTGSTHYEGAYKGLYFFILVTHIFLAAIVLPFVLFTAYRALTSEFDAHQKLAKITFPIWLYVSLTGVAVYLMISPFY